MPPLNYSAAELETLAPEERAALEAADGTNKAELEELAGGTEGAEAAAAAAGADTVAGAAGADTAAGAAGADTAAGAAGADTVAGAAAEQPAQNTPNPVTYRANVGDVAKEVQAEKDVIKTARGEKRAALMKLNDGEIDAEEYAKIEDAADAKIDAANDKILELNRAATRAEVSVELTQQQQANAWKTMLSEYVTTAKKDLGVDYVADEVKRGEFNSLLKAFAQEAGDKGMSDDNNMAASKWALDQAASIMALRYPKKAAAAPAPGTPAAGAAPAAAPAQPSGAAARAGIPPSLGAMPVAAAAPVGDDVMAKINTLEGEELEAYVATLPKDVANKLFASAQ